MARRVFSYFGTNLSGGGGNSILEVTKDGNTLGTYQPSSGNTRIDIPKEVEIVRYGVTTYSDIATAHSDGKLVILPNSIGGTGIVAVMNRITSGEIVFRYVHGDGGITNYTVNHHNTWTTSTYTASTLTPQQLNNLIDTEPPVQKKYDDDVTPSKLVIYQDPVEASPLSKISTPSIEVLNSTVSTTLGGGNLNNADILGHLFTVSNFYVPTVLNSQFEYILTQVGTSQNAHYLAIYELDEDNGEINLVCLSKNNYSNNNTTGIKRVDVDYVDSTYNILKPNKYYYAVHITNDSSLRIAGIDNTATFNLMPHNSPTPLSIEGQSIITTTSGVITPADIKNIKFGNSVGQINGSATRKAYLSLSDK